MPLGPDADAARHLTSVRWGRVRCPLRAPYELSFVSLRDFDTVWVAIEDDVGRLGLGEAVALPGYGWETADSVEAAVTDLLRDAEGGMAGALRQRCRDAFPKHPFAASAVLAALDLPDYLGRLQPGLTFPLNCPVAGDAPEAALAQQLDAALARGCTYVKVKVGRDVEAERRGATFLLQAQPSDEFRLVFDANQGFDLEAALAFAQTLRNDPKRRLLWFEQPVDRDDWASMERICREGGVPIVLDECVFGEAEIDRAAAFGAAGVKLKTFKNGGIARTLELAGYARQRGLKVVFGNGVATDIGNFAEFVTLAAGGDLFVPPSESSGFVKLSQPLVDLGLGIDKSYRFGCAIDVAAAENAIRRFVAAQDRPLEAPVAATMR